MRACSSRPSWIGPSLAIALGLAVWSGTSFAGDGFLDRAAPLQEAVPYGTEIEAPPTTPRPDGRTQTEETLEPADRHERPAPRDAGKDVKEAQ